MKRYLLSLLFFITVATSALLGTTQNQNQTDTKPKTSKTDKIKAYAGSALGFYFTLRAIEALVGQQQFTNNKVDHFLCNLYMRLARPISKIVFNVKESELSDQSYNYFQGFWSAIIAYNLFNYASRKLHKDEPKSKN